MLTRGMVGLAVGMLCAVVVQARAAEGPEVKPLAIGAAAPEFDLPGVDGGRYTLASFEASPILVLVFTANHCPTAQAYEERLIQLHRDYAERGVALVAISPNDPGAVRLDELGYSDLGDSIEDMKIRATEKAFPFPYLYDGETQAMSRAYGPAATPHVFIFDKERKLRFVGRVDDGENPAKITTRDTRDALEALLAGKPVPVETTKVFGCSIKWSEKRAWVAKGFETWAAEPVALEPADDDAIRKIMAGHGEKLRLVNVWATYCGPCVIEFPELVEMHRMYRGRPFELVTISADAPEKREAAEAFLKEQQASMHNVLYDKGDPYALIELVDPEWQGALPHSMLVAPDGQVLWRSSGPFDPLPLRQRIISWLGRTYHAVPGEGWEERFRVASHR
jgi:thiol-disulfide isomerase/thioredoxin